MSVGLNRLVSFGCVVVVGVASLVIGGPGAESGVAWAAPSESTCTLSAPTGGPELAYDGLNRLVSMGAEQVLYSGQGVDPVAVGDELFGRLPGGELATAGSADGDSTWWLSDRHRDVGFGVAGDGSLVSSQVFDPFGNAVARTGDAVAVGFQGDVVDPVSGLACLGARWYSSDRGGFVSRDAFAGRVSDPLTLNRYAYSSGDPLGQWDPSGFEATDVDQSFVEAGGERVHRLTVDGIRAAASTGIAGTGLGRSAINEPTVVVPSFSPPVVSRGFFRGVVDAVVAVPKLTIAVGADLGNCLADKVFVDTGAGCADTLRSGWATAKAIWDDPRVVLRACVGDLAYCAGGLVGGFAVVGARLAFGPPVSTVSGLGRVASGVTGRVRGAASRVAGTVGRASVVARPRVAGVGRALSGPPAKPGTTVLGSGIPLRPTGPSARHLPDAPSATPGRIPWNSYADYPKVTIGGREYANVGGRPYTQHAVDRMQPSGLGAPAGASGPGRSIAPQYVDDVLTGPQTVRKPVTGPNGEARVSHVSGTVEVITEGDIVITVITR